MGWFSNLFSRKKTLAIAEPQHKRLRAGVSQNISYFGNVIESLEHNSEVKGSKWYGSPTQIGIVRQMLVDPYVRASLNYRINPLRAGLWTIEAPTNKPEDIECAQYIHWNLTELLDFDEALRNTCLFHRDGFSLQEFTDSVATYPIDRFPLHKGRGNGILFNGIHHIPAWTVDSFVSNANNERILESFYQHLTNSPNSTKALNVKKNLILRVTQEQEGAIFTGFPTARSAFGPWKLKIRYLIIDAIKHERYGLGTPWGKLPEDYSASDRDNFELALAELRINEKGFLVTPSGFEVSLLETKQDSGTDIEQAINRQNTEIFVNVGAQHNSLGSAKFGSFALADVIHGGFGISVIGDANFITGKFNFGADGWSPIRHLQVMNYPTANCPKLKVRNLPIKNYEESLKTLAVLIDSGVVRRGEHLESAALEKLGLPLPENDTIIGEFINDLNKKSEPVNESE